MEYSNLEKMGFKIFGGQILSRVEAKEKSEIVNEDVKTIFAKTIDNGRLTEEYGIKNYKELNENFLTKEGDIVIKMSAPHDSAIIDSEHSNMLVSSFCAIIRKKDDDELLKENISFNDVNLWYISAYLNSPQGIEKLKERAIGSTIPMLSSGKVKELPIPLLEKKEQKEIGEEFKKYVENRGLIAKAIKLEEEKLAIIFNELEG